MKRYWPHLDPTRPPVDKPKERGRWEGALFVLALGTLLAAAILLTGCENTAKGAVNQTNGAASTYCDHGNRVYEQYSMSHGPTGIAVVPKDPSCE